MRLTVLYDAQCAFCRGCRSWLEGQPCFVDLEFLPAGGREVHARYPELGDVSREELVVVGDGGEVWRGDEAFITCLWALAQYREWAYRLSSSALRPLARKAFHLLSSNRRALPLLLGDAELAGALAREPDPACRAGEPCALPEAPRPGQTLGVGWVVFVFAACFGAFPLLLALLLLLNGARANGLIGAAPSYAAVLAAGGAIVGLGGARVLRRSDVPSGLVVMVGAALGFACDALSLAMAAGFAIVAVRSEASGAPGVGAGLLWLGLLSIPLVPVFMAVGVIAAVATHAWARRLSA